MLDPKGLKQEQEQWEEYYSAVLGQDLVQYDYRHTDGRLFSCIRKNLEECRQARDRWLESLNIRSS